MPKIWDSKRRFFHELKYPKGKDQRIAAEEDLKEINALIASLPKNDTSAKKPIQDITEDNPDSGVESREYSNDENDQYEENSNEEHLKYMDANISTDSEVVIPEIIITRRRKRKRNLTRCVDENKLQLDIEKNQQI